MRIEMDVGLYPFADGGDLHPVSDFIELLEQRGCKVEKGRTSLFVTGESVTVFEGVRTGYEETAAKFGCVLLIKVCNACAL